MDVSRGWSNQTTKQVGEDLVAAELSRLGFMCTPFAGNVPHYDISAAAPRGHIIAIQVKAIRGGSWQLDIRSFAAVTLEEKRQTIGDVKDEPYPDLWCVFVLLGREREDDLGAVRQDDRFFILKWEDLRDLVVSNHRAYLQKHGGVRPKKHDSYHTAVRPDHLDAYKGKWQRLKEELRGVNSKADRKGDSDE